MAIPFIPYKPAYSPGERIERLFSIIYASASVLLQSRDPSAKFAASVEITDRCNAGCHYCYVYPEHWAQNRRIKGYLELNPKEHRGAEQRIYDVLESLRKEGVVHITLVGGEPALAPRVLKYAAKIFPIVWVVTNGAAPLPELPCSTSIFVSIDGPPEHHNKVRDPLGFFAKHRYRNLTGMSAAITRNINASSRGAYVHCTLIPPLIPRMPELVDWLVQDIEKLRGIVVSGAATVAKDDPLAFTVEDRQRLKCTIESLACKYSWELFPFNQPRVNQLLFDSEFMIRNPRNCSVARRVKSLDFEGRSTGKCILRDADCETCACNITGLQRAVRQGDWATLSKSFQSFWG